MAGFMAGFGSAFSRTWEDGQARKAEQEADMFKMQYQELLTRKDKKDAHNKEVKKRTDKAKSLAEFYGQPSDSWTKIYDWLEDDIDVEKELSNGMKLNIEKNDVTSGDTSGPDDGSQDLATSAESSVNAQMSASGMTQPGAPADKGIFNKNPAQPATGGPEMPQPQSVRGPLGQAMGMGGDNTERLAQATMSTPEEVRNTMGSDPTADSSPLPANPDYKVTWSKPDESQIKLKDVNNLDDAVAYDDQVQRAGSEDDKATGARLLKKYQALEDEKAIRKAVSEGKHFEPRRGAIRDAHGNPTGQIASRREDGQGRVHWVDAKGNPVQEEAIYKYDQIMEEEIAGASTPIKKEIADYNAGVQDFAQMASTSSELATLANAMPEGVDISGQAASFVERTLKGAEGIIKIMTGSNAADPSVLVDLTATGANLSQLEAAEKQLTPMMGRIRDASLAAALIDIKATKLAYMWAAAQGQSGRNVNQQEFENFKRNAMGNGSPTAIKLNSESYIRDTYKSLKQKEQFINQNSDGVRQFKSEYAGMPFPLEIVDGIDNTIERDANLKTIVERSNSAPSELNQINPPKEKVQAPAGVPKEAAELWEYLGPEAKAEYERKAKEGAK